VNSVQTIFSGINHICVVTGDIDRAIRVWADRYGVGPWSVYTKDEANMTVVVDGEPAGFAMRVALASVSPTFRIELIQPLDERSPYARSLAEHGGADHVHHVRFEVEEYAAAAARLDDLGHRRLLEAEFDGAPGVDGTFAGIYFDTEGELGFVVEIGLAPPGFAMPPPESVYP
jgi:methylmalonyl-CoA/ethylmalonyl-CoA epimerase